MTIQLYVEKYCDNCCNFEPSVEKIEMYVGNQVMCQTTITCEHASICEKLEKLWRITHAKRAVKEQIIRNSVDCGGADFGSASFWRWDVCVVRLWTGRIFNGNPA